MMKKIKKLDVEADALLELVEVDGRQMVLKTAEVDEVILEKKFLKILAAHELPHIELVEDDELAVNQLLMEYIKDSPTLDRNPTEKSYRKWGEVVRKMHDIIYDRCIRILPSGEEVEIAWGNFVRSQLEKNVKKHRESKTLSEADIQRVVVLVDELLSISDNSYSIIHGDLHDNNAMLKGDDVVIFDKGSYMLYGDRFYDLATVAITCYSSSGEFPFLRSFIEGYGEDFMVLHKRRIELNVILRGFERFPNRFETQSGDVLMMFLQKLS